MGNRVQGDVVRTEEVLDCAKHVDLAVVGMDDLALPHIGVDHVGGGTVLVDVVRTVLGVVGDDDNGVARIGAAGDGLDQPCRQGRRY